MCGGGGVTRHRAAAYAWAVWWCVLYAGAPAPWLQLGNLEHSLQSNTLIVNHYKTVFLSVWSSHRMACTWPIHGIHMVTVAYHLQPVAGAPAQILMSPKAVPPHALMLHAGLGPVLLPAAESACEQLVSQGVGANGPEPGQSPEEAADAVWRKANDILWSAAEAVGDDCLLAAGYAADAEALCYGLPAVAVPAVRAACGALLHAADRLELHGAVPQLRCAAPRVFSAASLAMLAIISQASCRHAPSAKPGQVATGFPGLQPLLTAAATALDRGDGRPAGLASYGTVLSQVVLMLGEEHSLAMYGCGAEQTMHRPSRAAKSVAMKWMKGSSGLAGMVSGCPRDGCGSRTFDCQPVVLTGHDREVLPAAARRRAPRILSSLPRNAGHHQPSLLSSRAKREAWPSGHRLSRTAAVTNSCGDSTGPRGRPASRVGQLRHGPITGGADAGGGAQPGYVWLWSRADHAPAKQSCQERCHEVDEGQHRPGRHGEWLPQEWVWLSKG
ncbi:hypothetical protein HaLaN_03848 [Haematococcus lacustris]|uniref:Uncharacterized protein n=1 Tax=Haematococcus lacustris TaxID=44745 RepID=A0A699YFE1_HAELA|nr:hypothetical protein HaLaN_03848 [Haematococcus lacustris]